MLARLPMVIATFEQWLPAFLLTLVLEAPLVLWALGGRRGLGWLLLANALTHPALWFVLPPLFSRYATFLIAGELLVFAAEAAVYTAALRSRRGIWLSAAANAFSCGVGLLLDAIR